MPRNSYRNDILQSLYNTFQKCHTQRATVCTQNRSLHAILKQIEYLPIIDISDKTNFYQNRIIHSKYKNEIQIAFDRLTQITRDHFNLNKEQFNIDNVNDKHEWMINVMKTLNVTDLHRIIIEIRLILKTHANCNINMTHTDIYSEALHVLADLIVFDAQFSSICYKLIIIYMKTNFVYEKCVKLSK